jgi:hypothetical protein
MGTQHSTGMYESLYSDRKDVQCREELFDVTRGSKLCVLSTGSHYTDPVVKRLHGWASFPRGWKHFGMKTFWTEIARQVRVCKKLVDHLPARISCTQRILSNFLSHTWTENLSCCRTRLKNPPSRQDKASKTDSFLHYILYRPTVSRRSTLNSRTSFYLKEN